MTTNHTPRVDANQLRDQILAYQAAVRGWRRHLQIHPRSKQRKPKISEPLAHACMAISDGVSKLFRVDAARREDLQSAAMIKLLPAVEKFNPTAGSSPFSFLFRTGWNACANAIRTETRYRAFLARAAAAARAEFRDDPEFAGVFTATDGAGDSTHIEQAASRMCA